MDWYTRGAEYCRDNPDQIVIELATRGDQAAAMLEDAGSGYAVWGVVEVEGRPVLHVYRRNVSGAPWVADAADDERPFDEMLSGARRMALTPRVILPMTPANLQFGTELVMTGYAIQNPGDNGQNLALTAAWTAQARPQQNYQIRIELVDANGKVVGQRTTDPKLSGGANH
ncbi:MAG: hypothetical protein IPK16_03600 [Anaerolineales bacterium]|nr:hypothetical protein [Anaerolineales bacterium]